MITAISALKCFASNFSREFFVLARGVAALFLGGEQFQPFFSWSAIQKSTKREKTNLLILILAFLPSLNRRAGPLVRAQHPVSSSPLSMAPAVCTVGVSASRYAAGVGGQHKGAAPVATAGRPSQVSIGCFLLCVI